MDIIEKELSNIQIEYLTILKESLNLIDSDWLSVVDNINKFWYKHKKIIKSSLSNWFLPNETYLFTAACVLDYNDKGHLPFLLYGKQHIFDDPICRYAQSVINTKGTNFSTKLNEKIKDLIYDNILILENLNNLIYILPVSFLFNDDNPDILKNCDSIFLNMFNKEMSMKDYLQNVKTCNDLEAILKPDIINKIPFDTNDNLELSLTERIKLHREKNDYLPKEANDAEIFLIIVFGHISQTMNSIFICINYDFIPYLRYDVAFKYFTHLIGNFLKIENVELLLNKASLSYFTKQIFNKANVKYSSIFTYRNQCLKFEATLFENVLKNGSFPSDLTPQLLEKIILKGLEEFIYN